jgi:hypothetical protein
MKPDRETYATNTPGLGRLQNCNFRVMLASFLRSYTWPVGVALPLRQVLQSKRKHQPVSLFSFQGSIFQHVEGQAGSFQETERSTEEHNMRAADQLLA